MATPTEKLKASMLLNNALAEEISARKNLDNECKRLIAKYEKVDINTPQEVFDRFKEEQEHIDRLQKNVDNLSAITKHRKQMRKRLDD